ncbi:prepilin-type N-terminal cleavage/methylation domain-containing protein [Chitinimonas lacunae]|uniref:Prepilin-type N-terminal cleavage/methylation domain-containing protein n=1 Tax=Chitinimonas lacunae TaxID=1963018 RepID=A0ABV8MWR7_9NEIS
MPLRHRPVAAAAAGFTLLELLIVLFLIGVAAALTAPRLITFINSRDVRAARETLEDRLGQLRSQAILKNETQTGYVDFDASTFKFGELLWQPPPGWKLERDPEPVVMKKPPPPEVNNDLPPSDEGEEDPVLRNEEVLKFYADGSAKPVRLILDGPGRERYRFSVSALTGKIEVETLEGDDAS